MAGGRAKQFQAVLEKGDRALGWTVARVPFVPAEVWKKRVRLRVKGEVNGFPFRTSLFPDPANPGRFVLLVSRAMQEGAGVGLGGAAEFRLEADLEPREAELPDELAVLLDEEAGLREWYDGLSESMRREIGKWIAGVKSDAARMRRADQMAERLLGAMEAEEELPPVIAVAFRLRPKARAGWGRMTVTQRRRELLGVFYYQTPEARQRRVDKLCEEAEKH
ncbi:MAG TPA: YdeI/OmpD-associated family protein [Granulicella sp.]|nr:YdeI/OmpD-associated family protein [Granulicella sp.]